MSIPKALLSLRPGAAWVMHGDNYENITWLDEKQSKPSKEELLSEANIVSARELIPKSLIISRLYEMGKLPDAMAILDKDCYARARWYSPDKPHIYNDNKEVIDILKQLGIDAKKILTNSLSPPEVESL